MERIVAIKKLGKMLGKGFGYRVDRDAPTADERAEARERAKVLNEEFNTAGKAEAARKDALLNGDAEFQRLRAEVLRLRKAKDEAWSTSRRHRFTVGKTVAGLFFSVMAEGDSWEEVIRKIEASKAKATV